MSRNNNKLRMGIVGAGAIVRDRHLPGLKKHPEVEIVAVSNSTYESAEKFCQENAPHATPMANWADLLAVPDLDIVWIGTPPYMHSAVTLSALEAGKHVFCQARMAMDLTEATEMLTAARRSMIDAARRRRTHDAAAPDLLLLADLATDEAEQRAIPDDRLLLMFACAHPAIDRSVRAPLMLQTILGFDAASIASAFLVAPATMGQRLVRAKTKIKQAGIPFRLPDADDLQERLDSVLEAIYQVVAHAHEHVGQVILATKQMIATDLDLTVPRPR